MAATLDDLQTDVGSYIDLQQEVAADVLAEARTEFQDQMQAITTALSDIGGIEITQVSDPESLTYPDPFAPTPLNVSDIPEFDMTTFEDFGNDIDDIDGILDESYDTINGDVDVNIPALPSADDAPTISQQFVEAEYVSGLLDDVRSMLSSGLSGGSGISSSLESAIYARDRSRREEEHEKAAADITNLFSGRGFDLPTGAMAAALAQATNTKNRALEDQSRDVMVQQTALEQEYRKTVLNAITQLEQIEMTMHNSVQDRLLKADESRLAFLLEDWKISWERYKGLMDAAKIHAEVGKLVVDAKIQTNKNKADVNLARVEKYKADVAFAGMKIDKAVEAYAAEISEYETRLKKWQVDAETEGLEWKITDDQLNKKFQLALERAKWEFDEVKALRIETLNAAQTGAQLSAQVLASSLDSINTSVSLGLSGGLSEGHSFDETKHIQTAPNYNYTETHSIKHAWDADSSEITGPVPLIHHLREESTEVPEFEEDDPVIPEGP